MFKRFEAGSAIHLSPDRLEPVGLSFSQVFVPIQCHCRTHCGAICQQVLGSPLTHQLRKVVQQTSRLATAGSSFRSRVITAMSGHLRV